MNMNEQLLNKPILTKAEKGKADRMNLYKRRMS